MILKNLIKPCLPKLVRSCQYIIFSSSQSNQMISEACMPSDVPAVLTCYWDEKMRGDLQLSQVNLLQLCISVQLSFLICLPFGAPSLSQSASFCHTNPSTWNLSLFTIRLYEISHQRKKTMSGRETEAQRMEDSLASISILSVSQGNRVLEWRMLG